MQQTEQEETFPFYIDYISIPEQEGTSFFKVDIGVSPETTTAQVAARQEFTNRPRGQQQRRTASNEYIKQFGPGE